MCPRRACSTPRSTARTDFRPSWDELRWCLHQFDQHALCASRMNEAHVVAGRTLANATRGELEPLARQPLDGGLQVIDPEPDVIEPRLVHLGLRLRIDRLHQIDLDARDRQDVLVDILALAAIAAGRRHAEEIDPQRAQRLLARATDRDLLDAEDAERPRHFAARTSSSVRRPGRGALTRIDMFP